MTALSPCQQEEADTRMMLHLYHAAGQGHSKAFLRTVDSDVVVLAINIFSPDETFSAVDRIWNRKNMQRYSNPSHVANQMLGLQHCEVLPFFHAFTGCDLVSSMLGIGKKTAWNAWNAYPKVTNTFVAIIQDPSSIILDSLHVRRLQRWTVLMYSKNCDAELLNDAMKVMFTHRGTSPSTGMWQGEVFAISDCLVVIVCAAPFTFAECTVSESSSMALTIAPAGHDTPL